MAVDTIIAQAIASTTRQGTTLVAEAVEAAEKLLDDAAKQEVLRVGIEKLIVDHLENAPLRGEKAAGKLSVGGLTPNWIMRSVPARRAT